MSYKKKKTYFDLIPLIWQSEKLTCGCTSCLNWMSSSLQIQRATVATSAKRKGVYAQLNANPSSGYHSCTMQSKKVQQAELFLCVYKTMDLIYSRSAFMYMSGVHIYAIPESPCNSANGPANSGAARAIPVWPEFRNDPEHIYQK